MAAKRGHAVFGQHRVAQTAMGDRQAQEIGMQVHHSISKMASISTATPRGRAGTETAARAWRPLFAKDLHHRVEQPMITSGWSVDSPVELTKPPSLTTRLTPVQRPQRRLGLRQQQQPAATRGLGALGGGQVGADPALAVNLARDEQHRPRDHIGDIVRRRCRGIERRDPSSTNFVSMVIASSYQSM